jgi:shikimate dehydrogenase
MTDRYAVIGQPVSHSKSPWIHAAFARATGQSLEYGRIESPRDGFAAAVEQFRRDGGKGLNVTLPFKEEAFRYCSETSPRAREAGAVNTLAFGAVPFGDNTDGVGLVRDLSVNVGMPLAGKRVLLLGAGGAAQGVAGALLECGLAALVIANRTAARAALLARRFPPAVACPFDALPGERFDLVINATSAGLAGEALPLPAGLLRPGVLAYDMIYGRDTPFLAAARAAGARASDGAGMLVEQAAESFFLWRGVRPPTAPVLAALRSA